MDKFIFTLQKPENVKEIFPCGHTIKEEETITFSSTGLFVVFKFFQTWEFTGLHGYHPTFRDEIIL